MFKILIASKSFGYGETEAALDELFGRYNCSAEFQSLAKIGSCLQQFDGMVIGTEEITEEHLKRAGKLKVIIKYGVGIDNIPKEKAKAAGIKVLNLPGINCEAVAEMAFALMMTAARKIAVGDRFLREGKWEKRLGIAVRNKVLGLLGTGAVGMSFARMVRGLEMSILGYDIRPNKELEALGGRYVSFEKLLQESDFLSVHVPLTKETYHLIGKKELQQMKKTAIVINTSRGSVLDEQELYRALQDNEIGGAALDVFEMTPPINSPLLEMENVVCTPHMAAYDRETLRRMDEECIAKLSSYLEAEKVKKEGHV